MDGILLVDKPRGMTSHDVISSLRRALQMKRIGHAGTLDPDATGLLTVCLGKATKVSALLAQSDKTYLVKFTLGVETNTYDSTGEIVAERPVNVDRVMLTQAIKGFLGSQQQKPPRFSAVKIAGKRLYEYAREGEEVELPVRNITIYSIRVLSFEGKEGELEVVCSKGTYVRSLVHDLGQALQTGGMTTAIRRTESGALRLEKALPLQKFLEAESAVKLAETVILPISAALMGLPKLRVVPRVMERVLHGAGLGYRELRECRWDVPAFGPIDSVLLVGDKGEAVALGAYDGESTLKVTRVL